MKKKLKCLIDKYPALKAAYPIYRGICSICHEFVCIPAIAQCVAARIFFPQKTIILRAWILKKNGAVRHNNWGDDINVFFFSEATGKRVLLYPSSRLAHFIGLKNFVLIGSTIQWLPRKNSVVWGSGLINDRRGFRLPAVPCKILAVRGPLTREWVLAQGVDCPAVYGDPALLLPKFYSPKKLLRSRVGIIPHHATVECKNAVADRLAALPDVRLIKIQGYENWRDFIDQICSCDFVFSESLHGLIVAEAYGVPAVRVEFSEHISGFDFKFRDFYSSIGKPECAVSVKITDSTTIEELLEKASSWRPGTIDTRALLDACPFKLHKVPTVAAGVNGE